MKEGGADKYRPIELVTNVVTGHISRCRRSQGRQRMRPLRTCRGVAAIVVAASCVLQHWLFGLQLRCFVTMMRGFAQTAGARRRSPRPHRHRNDRSEKRNQQQKSGSNAMHLVR